MSPPHGGAVNVGAATTSRIAPARSRLLSQVVLNIEQRHPDRASDWQFVNRQLQIYIQNQMRRFSQQQPPSMLALKSSSQVELVYHRDPARILLCRLHIYVPRPVTQTVSTVLILNTLAQPLSKIQPTPRILG